jgi:hypothetical protein
MKIVPNPLVLFTLIGIVAGGLAYAQPQLPKGSIPEDIAPNLRNSIEKLHS